MPGKTKTSKRPRAEEEVDSLHLDSDEEKSDEKRVRSSRGGASTELSSFMKEEQI
jgi:hypothetical protein